MFDYCVIMAGGSGTRLWPLSNSSKPKQFLPVSSVDKKTFFDLSLERAFSIIEEYGWIIIVAGKNHVSHIASSCTVLNDSERQKIIVIPEPEAKNTAAAVLCALVFIEKTSTGNKKVFVLTSDHLIAPKSIFTNQALIFTDYIERGNLGVFGIPPFTPTTGFGYIEAGATYQLNNMEDTNGMVKKAVSFHEKPDEATAIRYLKAGNFYWNSGMFAFSSQFMKGEFLKHAPDIVEPFEKLSMPQKDAFFMKDRVFVLENWTGLAEAYRQIRKISFDFAVVTKCEYVIMIAADFNWRDIGSWDEYADLQGNSPIVEKNVFRVDSENVFVDSDIPVALCGVDDLIVVVRSDKENGIPTVLITKKGKTQKVSELVEQIKEVGREELL